MNDDRQLLELAAKAAGYRIDGWDIHGVPYQNGAFDSSVSWNPLTDDGDALRLAVKLNMKVYPGEAYPFNSATADYDGRFGAVCDEDECKDPYAATRRCITRAAAEIGKEMA